MAVPSYLREQVVEQGDRKEELLLALVDTIADQEPEQRFLTIATIGGGDALIDFDHIACVCFGVRFLEIDAIRVNLSGGAELHQEDTELTREWWTRILTGGRMSELKRVRENESVDRAAKIAADAIDLFVEDRDRHGFDEAEARCRATEDISRGCGDEALEPVIRRGWEGA